MTLWDALCSSLAQVFATSACVLLLSKATLLLAVAWLIHSLLARANPRWRVLLWRGVAIGLVLVAVRAVGLPGLEIRIRAPERVTTIRSPSQQPVAETSDQGVLAHAPVPATAVPVSDETTAAVHRSSVEVRPEADGGADSLKRSVPWQAVLFGIWGAGAAWLVVRLAIGYLRLARRLRTSQPAPEAVAAEAARIAAALGCRKAVEIRTSRVFPVPFLYGLRRPIVVLPERMCDASDCRQLPAILAHELAHTRSWDLVWNVGLQLISIALWFHPLAWRIGSAHRAACDRVCDAVSASYLGDVPTYCRTLARLALEAGASAAPVGLAMARGCDVRRRLAVLERKLFAAPLKRRAVAGVAMVGLAALVLLAGVRFVLAESRSRGGEGQASAPSAPSASTASPAPSAPKEAAGLPKDEERQKTGSERSARPGFRPMRVHVSDPDGKPIVNAGVTVRAMTHVPLGPFRYRTNAEGTAEFEVPEDESLDLQLLVWHPDHVTAGAHWKSGAVREPIPEEFAVTLERGTVLGGIVRNEQGQPVAGADVTVSGSKQSPGQVRWTSINDTMKTDAEGKWASRRIPAVLKDFDLKIEVRHPDYVSPTVFDVANLPIDDLRAQTAVLVVGKGIAVEGIVTDPQGKPIAGATVGLFREPWRSGFSRSETDQDGHYRLPPSEPGTFTVAAAASGYAPDSRSVTVGTEPITVDLRLRQGEMIRLRVVDEDGKPLAGAVVGTLLQSRYMQSLMLEFAREGETDRNLLTDAEGRWSRLWLPNEELTFHISKPRYAQVQKSFAADEREHVVTLESGGWSVSGRVVDRETKAPVKKFRVVEGDAFGPGPNDMIWRESQPVENERGQYRAAWDTSGDSRRVIRIEAEGYLPSEVRRLKADERQATFNVELTKGQDVTGVVLSPDGKPLAGAEVVLSTATRGLYLRNGRPALDQAPLIARTGADGRFSFTPQRDPYMLIALGDQGYAEVEGGPGSKEITLRPWARVEGTLRIGNQPGVNETVRLDFGDVWLRPQEALSRREQIARRNYFDYEAQTDAEGRFIFDRVRPGKATIFRYVQLAREGSMSSWAPTNCVPVEFVPGQTLKVELGGTGRPVIGRVAFAGNSRPGFDFSGNAIHAERLLPDAEQSDPTTQFVARMEQDGSFRLDDLPAGEYLASAYVSPQSSMFGPGPREIAGRMSHKFTVPDMPGGRSDEPLDLGILPLEPRESR